MAKDKTKFVGLTINKDSELLALTEDGSVYIIVREGDIPVWEKIADFVQDEVIR